MNVAWLVLFALAAIAVLVLQHRHARQRAEVIAVWAARHGLSHRRGPDRKLAHDFLEFAALSRGDDLVATNVCRGFVAGRETCVFDLAWKARDSDSETNLTAVFVKTDFPLIPLRIRQERALERLGEAFGVSDINFESAAFSERFHVTSADRKFAHDVIHPRMIEYLLENAAWPIELAGWHCLVWSSGRLAPAQLDAALALAQGVVAHPRSRAARVARRPARKGLIMALRIVVGVVVAVGLWLLVTYNRLVRLRQYCRESWATIDSELKRRHDLIPNLVAAVRGYAAHEADVLTAATAARGRVTAAGPREIALEEQPIVAGMQSLLAVAERYPELKAGDNFLRLQADLADTEDRIQSSRRIYNANVRELNTGLQSFPSNLIARQLGFAEAEFFEIERAVVHAVVDVSFPDVRT